MLKINKLADYGLMVMSCLAHRPQALNAREITAATHLKLPTVSKVLKALTKAGLLTSLRGSQGGYSLARPAEYISLSSMLEALEGDMSIVECAQQSGMCQVEHFCGIRHNWRFINQLFQQTLNEVSLADMLKPTPYLQKKLGQEHHVNSN